jgi:hypothetical protein
MSDRFLEQRINSRFYVELGNISSDTCAVLAMTYGGNAVKKKSQMFWTV